MNSIAADDCTNRGETTEEVREEREREKPKGTEEETVRKGSLSLVVCGRDKGSEKDREEEKERDKDGEAERQRRRGTERASG